MNYLVTGTTLLRLADEELDKARALAPSEPKPFLDFLAGQRVVIGDLIGAVKAICAENEALRAGERGDAGNVLLGQSDPP